MDANIVSVRRGRSPLYPWLIGGALILLVMGGLIGWGAYRESKAAGLLKERVAAIQSMGHPMDNAGVTLWFKENTFSAGTSAWQDVLEGSKAASHLPMSELPVVGEGTIPSDFRPGVEWPDAERVGTILREISPLLGKVHRANEFPKPVWMPIQFNGIGTLLDETQESRAVARFLYLDALHALYERDRPRAMKSIQSLQGTAESFDWSFCMVTQLVSVALNSIHKGAIQSSLNMDLWNEEELARLQGMLIAPRNMQRSWNDTGVGERAFMWIYLQTERDLGWGDETEGKRMIPLLSSGKLKFLEMYSDWFVIGKGGFEGLRDRSKEWVIAQGRNRNKPDLDGANRLMQLVTPAIDSYASALLREEESRRLLVTAIGIKQYQKKNQRWPERLGDLKEVGLESNTRETIGHQPFGYQVVGEVAYVWTADSTKELTVPSTLPELSSPELEDPWHFITIR